ncbi:MAG TPA: Asd/ArgC dimerization domain-containing protein [Candidatus Polarisedimenticolia bacterium]|nr:Asd/ArgC dimerization domain-containing protein [Candidatus Polarisedimenticolia bacterium]
MAVREKARTAAKAHLALFDATTLIAKAVKEQLVARSFPKASVRLFTSRNDPDANLTEFGGEAMLVTDPDIDALDGLDIAFLCGTPREGGLYLDWPARKGFVAIDLTSAASEMEEIPLVNAAVNPEAISRRPGIIAIPHAVSQILSTLLAPVLRGPGLQQAAAVVFQPASGCGDEGIEELYQQTVGLLNFREVPSAVFGRQIAFNLVPTSLYGEGAVPGGAQPRALAREVQRVTGGGYELSVEVVLVPVFHCHAVLLYLVLPSGATRTNLMTAFARSPEIRVAGPGEPATPVDEAGKPGIVLAGARQAREGSAFWIWAVTDDLQAGTALNAVRIAEYLLTPAPGRGDA